MLRTLARLPRTGPQPLLRRGISRSAARAAARPSKTHLPGHPESPYVARLDAAFLDGRPAGIPTYRLTDGHGTLLEGVDEASLNLGQEEAVAMYRTMQLLPALDLILYASQRQGRVSFWMTSSGEEAAIVGSAAGLRATDEVFAQYRELGVLLWRGYGLDEVMNQVFGTAVDHGKARQMPVHFGSTKHHFHTISSPLATQIPQAAGAAYALKRSPGREEDVAVCYFGEGAASEGDAHAGMNIAATLRCPVLFIVRNNGFAISTPSAEQYCGDGIASRGPGYGIPTIRVDGNDALAVRSAVQTARARAIAEHRPMLIECMTYRVGHHSTSDDSSAYRSASDVDRRRSADNPLHRMAEYLKARGWWNDKQEEEIKKSYRRDIVAAMSKAEKLKRPSLSSMFDDTYVDMPENLKDQRAELARLVELYGETDEWKKELQKHEFEGKDLAEHRRR
ncbi:putative 2-oxoisovalerate dehydrogenase alpha subunit mitochondrial precursor [Tilletiopsis washingtonensis]|uniref:2-oxoisovalerate dehydrogenase subunit alpha n=1 Tax=Tilletiopsis washingtonensis TaxID=58919 RepID=A0A316ZEX5_9BASI|nr:putative 2-oxoisovalerate dehydrogenase alpha subunit mitochondrial precursor [Tilletiopsis washingtonensis]PWO00301.1 putative 2-oxoisovalerate dehydrogenase alpha subunit mitochondrial precursor [Tilletiopsis washingtonensis]